MQMNIVTKDPQVFNFPVLLESAFDMRGNQVPRTKLVVRKDTDLVMGTVSDRYRLVTHKEMEEVTEPFLKKFGKVETTYSLEKGGAKLLATHTFKDVALNLPGHKMPGQKKVGDIVNLRGYSSNSYNSTTAYEFSIGALVLRCLNGATAFRNYFNLRFKHIGSPKDLVFPEPETVVAAFQEQGRAWEKWADIGITGKQIHNTIDEGFKLQITSRRSVEQNKSYFSEAETIWDLYNAFTYVITHAPKVRESGKLTRFDKLNGLFNHTFKELH